MIMMKRETYFSDFDRLDVDYKGKCVLVVDMKLYFPYPNQEICKGLFWFSETPEAALAYPPGYISQAGALCCNGLVLNHRDKTDRRYVTLSGQYGRRVARGGVYMVCSNKDFDRMKYLNICYTVSSEPMNVCDKVPTMSFPVEIEPYDGTEDTGIIYLGIKIDLDDPNKPYFDISTHRDYPEEGFFYQRMQGYSNKDGMPPEWYERIVCEESISDMEHYGAVSTTVIRMKQWRKDWAAFCEAYRKRKR